MLVNPASILLFGNNTSNEIEPKSSLITDENPASICFNDLPSNANSMKCVFWDEDNFIWNTSGVALQSLNRFK